MKKLLLTFLVFSFTLIANEPYFTTYPNLSPDGKTIIFCYDEDIWKVPASGGNALRITGMEGRESHPAFSPDGKWIAFTGRQDGNSNIYLLPVHGGKIKQLTFNDGSDYVESWSWDSKDIYILSNRYNQRSVYKISIDGGTPERLFDQFFNWPHNFVVHPKTGEYIFNESWESSTFVNRKRYKGAFNPDLKSFDSQTGEYKELTSYNGKDMLPTFDKNGNLYFVSDEGNDEFNLYTFENSVKTQLTNFESSIKLPKVNADGGYVVFEKDYQIFLYDVSTKSSKKVNINIYDNNTLPLSKEYNVANEISNFDVSSDGKKIVFVAKGELFVSDIKGKFVKQLDTNPTEKVVEVKWLKDNETILFTQTAKGWENLFTIKADGSGKEKQHTFDEANNREIEFNSDKTKGVYFSGRHGLKVIDLKSFKNETVVKDEFWAIYTTPARFSPDDKYLVYVAYRNFEHDIFVYDFENKKSQHITKTGVTDTSPFWSPDGKYIYFTTQPYPANYPWGWDDPHIYRVALQKYDKPFKADEFNKLFKEEKKDTTKPTVKINFTKLNERWERVIVKPGIQDNPYVIQKGDETTILFNSNHDSERSSIWKYVIKPFGKNETKKITGATSFGMFVVESKDKYYTLIGGNIQKLNLSGNKTEKINISHKFEKNLHDEFTQMFFETWTNIDENFYDENFRGVDWKAKRDYYKQFLPKLRSRADLRRMMDDLMGELNASHLAFRSTGDEEDTFYEYNSLVTGILFDNENPFTVERIVNNSPADKEDKKIMAGDVLTKVNGEKVDKNTNREKYFLSKSAGKELLLTFERNGQAYEVNIHPTSRTELYDLVYTEWEESRQSIVDEKSKNRISHIHMRNMTPTELEEFYREIVHEYHYKDALILDLRYNRGGNVHDQVLQLLSQKQYMQWKYRDGEFTPQPNFTPSDKPIVLLINEQSLSDAELTAVGFKELELGTIIGTETYRWLIFTTNVSMIDGSVYRLPSWGCYYNDGKDIEEVGAKPDIFVDNTFKDRVENKDPQLEKAIEEILKQLN